jgi:hypothetical protein
MMNFPELQALLGTEAILEQGQRWEQSALKRPGKPGRT